VNDDQRNWAQLVREIDARQKRSRELIQSSKDLIRVNEEIRQELQAEMDKAASRRIDKTH
jgi:hypothetical protein